MESEYSSAFLVDKVSVFRYGGIYEAWRVGNGRLLYDGELFRSVTEWINYIDEEVYAESMRLTMIFEIER